MSHASASSQRILVIGGAGYIGSVLTRRLLDAGYRVRVLDAFLFGRESLREIESHPQLEIVEGDIRRIDEVTRRLDGVDGVILLAALVGEPACDIDPKITVDVNWIATLAVARACQYLKIPRFIFASTDSIYGIREGIMREDSDKNPISLYARLKLDAEKEIMAMCRADFKPTILRMSTIYGLSPRMRFDLVVNVLAMHATLSGKIKIFGGKQWRPFVEVSDAAEAYLQVLQAPLEKVGGQIFNVGSNEQNYQIGSLGEFVNEVFPEVQIETIPQSPDLRDYYVNCDKITSQLGYRVKKTVPQAMREIRNAITSGKIKDPKAREFYNVPR